MSQAGCLRGQRREKHEVSVGLTGGGGEGGGDGTPRPAARLPSVLRGG